MNLDPILEDVKNLEIRLSELEVETNTLKGVDGNAIQFYNLGFTSKSESDAWLELNSPGGNFGYLVNFHTVMEHIHQAITDVDALKQLQNVYKLKLQTISEALSVTSFEVSTPRFLSSSGLHAVIGNDVLFFSHISSYKQWNDPSSGFKLRLKRSLKNLGGPISLLFESAFLFVVRYLI